jgi:hypothetical protein
MDRYSKADKAKEENPEDAEKDKETPKALEQNDDEKDLVDKIFERYAKKDS